MKKITLLLFFLLLNLSLLAQWNTNTDVNTLIADSKIGDQQSITNANGETLIVFWKPVAAPTNYELRLQKLDALGNKVFGTEGKLISNAIPMSTYTSISSLNFDNHHNLLIGVTGTLNSTGFAYKMDADGNHIWASSGISIGTAYLVRIFPLNTGELFLTWMDGNMNAKIRKYSFDGLPVWTTPTDLGTKTAVANAYPLTDGGATVIYHKIGTGVNSDLYAQRVNTNGALVWTTPTMLFNSINKTVYNATYYGAQDGDVVYYSYRLSHNNRFDSYVQRINPDGTLPWGLTGVDFDTNQTLYEQETQIAFTPMSQYIWAICRYTNSTQGSIGVYVQKFNKTTGARLLTDNAKEVFPVSATTVAPAGNFRLYNDKPVFLTMTQPLPQQNILRVTVLDENGNFYGSNQFTPIATFGAAKSFINFHPLGETNFVATFVETKGTDAKGYAQRYTYSTTLGINDVELPKISYNNPVNDILQINSENAIQSISVHNILGQLITNVAYPNATDISLNCENWPAGLNIATIKYENSTERSLQILKR